MNAIPKCFEKVLGNKRHGIKSGRTTTKSKSRDKKQKNTREKIKNKDLKKNKLINFKKEAHLLFLSLLK